MHFVASVTTGVASVTTNEVFPGAKRSLPFKMC
jgi:hypothetical protein